VSAHSKLPIRPARRTSPRYPRVGVVWGAFAAGTLVVGPSMAQADCALPAHRGAVDPGGNGKGHKAPRPTPVAVSQPLPGKIAAPKPTPPGEAVAVQPPAPIGPPQQIRGGGQPARVAPPKPPAKVPPRKVPPLDGDVAHVGPFRTLYVHPHGPDEPCHEADGTCLIVRVG